MVQQAGFFDVDERLKRLSDQFEARVAAVDVEIFRADHRGCVGEPGAWAATDSVFRPSLFFQP